MRLFTFTLAAIFAFQAIAADCPKPEDVKAALLEHIAYPDQDTLTQQVSKALKAKYPGIQELEASLDNIKNVTVAQGRIIINRQGNERVCHYFLEKAGNHVVSIAVPLN